MAVLHNWVLRIWYGNSLLALLLLPFSLLYGLITGLRRGAYKSGLIHRPKLSVPVVIVGNISVGGTGKTPVVAWLAQELNRLGHQPAVVSRGYGGAGSPEPVLLKSNTTAAEVGDEAVLLRHLTGCPVIVCPDRVAAVQLAVEQGADIVLADDGLQHYRLRRTLELAVVDGARGVGNGWLLPAGPLREGISRLQQVDAVLINGGSDAISGIDFHLAQGDAVSLVDGSCRPLVDFSGEVWSVAGIGNPERFHNSLRALGLSVHEVDVPDHGTTDLAALRVARDIPVLMTQKDATKYSVEDAANAWYVPVTLAMNDADAARLLALIADRCVLSP